MTGATSRNLWTMAVILGLASIVGCPMAKQIGTDLAACALGQVPGAVASVIPDVTSSLSGTPTQWSTELHTLEFTCGADFAICAIEAVVHDLTAKHAALSPVVMDRAQTSIEYLKIKYGLR